MSDEFETVAALQAEWGFDYDLKIAQAARAARFFGGSELIEWLNKTGHGNAVELVRAFAKVGEYISVRP